MEKSRILGKRRIVVTNDKPLTPRYNTNEGQRGILGKKRIIVTNDKPLSFRYNRGNGARFI